jgi:hypothetical protein
MNAKSLRRQLAVLNDAYKPHSISFKLQAADMIVAYSWSLNCKEYATKKYLRKGTYADLNVYFFPSLRCVPGVYIPWNQVVSGYSMFPAYGTAGDDREVRDGVSVRADSVPGSRSERNLGMTLVHEVGHWFGRKYTPCAKVLLYLTILESTSYF